MLFSLAGERKLDRLLTGTELIITVSPTPPPPFFYFSRVLNPLGKLIYTQQLTSFHDLFLVYCNFDAQSLCQFAQGTGDQYDWLFNKGTTSSGPETGPSADISSTGQELEASLTQPL